MLSSIRPRPSSPDLRPPLPPCFRSSKGLLSSAFHDLLPASPPSIPQEPSSQIGSSRTKKFYLLVLLFLGGMGAGCGKPPCQASADCEKGEECIQGLCQATSEQTSETTEYPQDAAGQEKSAPEIAQDAAAEKEALPEIPEITEAQTEAVALPEAVPAPCQGAAPPRCRTQGPCQGLAPRCEGGLWHCTLPPEYEENEQTCDGKDNDCDGQIDEAIQRDCYEGAAGTKGVGLCKEGKQICNAGRWGACIGQVIAQTEVCDGQDNDCDGQIDNGMERSCYEGAVGTKGIGPCREGKQTCNAGQWGACVGQTLPSPEICDGQDNDCNGQIDDGLVQECYEGAAGTKGVGLCKAGQQTCNAGRWGTCVGQTLPSAEVCDGQDNDCDGQIDDGLERSCYEGMAGTKGVGLCKEGKQICNAGQWGACVGQTLPTPEICDGQDNDCDGQIDDGVTRECYNGTAGTAGVGLCKKGLQICNAGRWGTCVGEILPSTEICDGKDNNCDGRIDLGAQCGVGRLCMSGQCVCDATQGYFPNPLGTGCVKDGDACPAGFGSAGRCLDSQRMVICDPQGRLGILHCPTFNGSQCVTIPGYGQGCQAPQGMAGSSGTMCIKLTANYPGGPTWDAVMFGAGTTSYAAIQFSSCAAPDVCGTVITSFGYQTTCLCGERSVYCPNERKTAYDVATRSSGQCTWMMGSSFGCTDIIAGRRNCEKSIYQGFPRYLCQ